MSDKEKGDSGSSGSKESATEDSKVTEVGKEMESLSVEKDGKGETIKVLASAPKEEKAELGTSTKESWADIVEETEKGIRKETPSAESSGSKSATKDIFSFLIDSDEIEKQIAVYQKNPDHPLHSAKEFSELGLSKDLLDGIYGMKFQKPSKIQEKALPMILQQRDTHLVAQSQSGTGKTAAFVLGMLDRIDENVIQPQALCICHTRELALQVFEVMQEMGKHTNIKMQVLVPEGPHPDGEDIVYQAIVGTPGTLLKLTQRRKFGLNALKIFVLDEADELLGKPSLRNQVIKMKRRVPKDAQILLFSATFKNAVKRFIDDAIGVGNYNRIFLKMQEVTIEQIKQYYIITSGEEQKFEKLCEIYADLTVGQSIIFVNTKRGADALAARMKEEGHPVSVTSSLHTKQDRDQVMTEFRKGETKVLIATDVLARGVDVLQVNTVINFDVPVDEKGRPDETTYIHRIGRCGRFGRNGVAITLVHDGNSQQALNMIKSKIDREIVVIEDVEEIEQEE